MWINFCFLNVKLFEHDTYYVVILFLALHIADDNIQYTRDKGFSYSDIPAGAAQLLPHLKDKITDCGI